MLLMVINYYYILSGDNQDFITSLKTLVNTLYPVIILNKKAIKSSVNLIN